VDVVRFSVNLIFSGLKKIVLNQNGFMLIQQMVIRFMLKMQKNIPHLPVFH